MEDCRDMGKTRDIGLSSFNSQQIQRLLDSARIPPVAIQVELSKAYQFTSLGFFFLEFHKMPPYVVEHSPDIVSTTCEIICPEWTKNKHLQTRGPQRLLDVHKTSNPII